MADQRSARQIVMVVFEGVQSLDVTGPLEVFTAAADLLEASATAGRGSLRAERWSPRGYEVRLLSMDGAPLRTSSGLTITPQGRLEEAPRRIDTLLVPGGRGVRVLEEEGTLAPCIGALSRRSRRTASVCTGAFLLAAAGLLDGRRATTHWAFAAKLAQRYPRVSVDPDPIFVRDGAVWTSAGVTAGMDLALALVEQDHDRETALTIARHLVMFLRRPGNQSQFSATLAAQQPEREPLREVQRAVLEEVAADHSVEAMALRAHMSQRHFARAFRAETGMTPGRYVERVRLEAARRRLEEGAEPIGSIAAACGFGTAETMRRVFLRVLEVGPAEYRRRFQVGGAIQTRQRRQNDEHSDPALRRVHGAGRDRAV